MIFGAYTVHTGSSEQTASLSDLLLQILLYYLAIYLSTLSRLTCAT